MKKTILALLALGAVWNVGYGQTFSGGEGTAESPYLIKSKEDMAALSTAVEGGNTFAGKHFRLENDLSYTSSDTYTPIGYTNKSLPKKFAGEFNGNNKTISGVTINGTYYVGLFSHIDKTGSVHDLVLDNFKVTSTNSGGGALAGKSDGTVSRIQVRNLDFTSTNGSYKGGLVGFLNSGEVSDCSVSGSIIASSSVGGVVGQNYGAVRRCHTNATIVVSGEGSSSAHIGGVVSITLTLSGDTARVEDSYFTGSIQGAPQNNCGGVTATLNVGYIERCWNGGYIASSGNAGGLVATYNAGIIRDCYNAGTVVDNGAASGGLAGLVSNSNHKVIAMERCLNLGNIMFSAVTREPGCELIGTGADQVTITNCYYDRQMSGYTDSERGMTTAALTSGNALPGFDASVWKFAAGMYPRLAATAETDAAKLNAAPVFLAAGEDHLHVKSAFTVSGNSDIEWNLRGGSSCRLNGNTVSVTRTATVQNLVLTAYLGDYERRCMVSVYPQIFQGEGTAASPYLISDKNDMVKFAEAVNQQKLDFSGEYLRMTGDIDMQGVTDFQPIGFNTTDLVSFNGTFDGAGHSIKNMSIDSRTNKVMNVGLFIIVSPQGTVKNLVIDRSCRFIAFRNYGAIAATVYGTIENCRNYADVPTTDGYSGGIAAFVYGTIRGCMNAGTISSSERNGALGGIFYSGYAGCVIEECQNTGRIEALHDKATNLGGIGGSCYGTMKNCLNTGAIVGGTNSSAMGGLLAQDNASAEVSTSISLAPITVATTTSVGGAIGNPRGTYNKVYADRQMTLYSNGGEGIGMLSTAELTVAKLEGFGSEWTLAAGRYPVLTRFKELPEVQLGSMPFTLPDYINRNEITAPGTLCQASGLTWSVDGSVFSISGDKLQLTAPESYATATLKATYQGCSREIPLGALPNLFSGEGTQASPWLIKTPAELQALSKSMESGQVSYANRYFALGADLDMSGITGFAPIAATGKFNGKFDGRNHVIDHLTIASTTAPAALFGTVGESGAVSNLTLGAASSISGKGSVGAFISTLEGTLMNCVNRATVKSTAAIIGGLVGTAKGNAHLENLTNEADITTDQAQSAGIVGSVATKSVTARNLVNRGAINNTKGSYVAGIVGRATGVTVNVAVNYGKISGIASDVAGIVGYASDATVLDSCLNYGDISGKTEVAGLIGYSKGLTITSSLNAGNISATYQTAGGLIGSGDQPEVAGCANFGDVTNSNASLGTSYAGAGGITGKGDPKLKDCCNFGTITAKDNVGSIAGMYGSSYRTFTITNFYNVGAVKATGTAPKGLNVFIGKAGKPSYVNCWYDSQAVHDFTTDNGATTRELLAKAFGTGFTDSENGYPMPVGIAGYEVSRLYRTALLFHVAADHYGNVTDYFRVKCDPELAMTATDVFLVKPDNRVNLKSFVTGDYALATTLGSLKRSIALHLNTQETMGVGSIDGAAEVISVEYYGVDGLRVLNPAKGMMVVRRTVFADGTAKVDKVVY